MTTINHSAAPRECQCGKVAPWKVRRGSARPAWVCHDHAHAIASRPGVAWNRASAPARTSPRPGVDPYGGNTLGIMALTVTANPRRGKWRTSDHR